MNKVLIDTNIFLYARDPNSHFQAKAIQFLNNPNLELFTSSKNISEYFAVCTKFKIDNQMMWDFYEDIKNSHQILFPNETSLLHFENLIKKYNPKGNQVFDIEIASIMLANNIQTIATFNTKDFIHISEVNILSN